MNGFGSSEFRAIIKEIVKKRIATINEGGSDEEDVDDLFLGFAEEDIESSLQNLKKWKLSMEDTNIDKRIRTCSVNLSQSELLLKDVYIGHQCHNCKELKSDISIPINYDKNRDNNSHSPVKLKKIVVKVFREQCFISVSIPENVTLCTES